MRVLKSARLRDTLIGVALALAMLGLVVSPRETSDAGREGIRLCLDVIIPSLFPFFVISTLIIELGLARYFGAALERVMRPFFNVSGPCSIAVVLGFVGGYPLGAHTAISLYEKKLCSREEAERLLAFCNNSGPAFILGAVGAGILGSSTAGWLLYLAHTAASLTVGFIFRFYKRKKASPSVQSRERGREAAPKLSKAFVTSVKSSASSIFNICAFVVFFTVAVRLLFISGILPAVAGFIGELLSPFGTNPAMIKDLLTGLIEMTSGLFSLQGSASAQLAGQMAMAAFMLGWAGLSVHCHVLTFIGRSGLSPWTYISGKLLHGLISAVYAFGMARYLGMDSPVATLMAEQLRTLAKMSFWQTFSISLKITVGIVAGFALLTACLILKRSRRKRAH